MEVDKAPSEEEASKVTSQSWGTHGFPQPGAWPHKQHVGQALGMQQKSGLGERSSVADLLLSGKS